MHTVARAKPARALSGAAELAPQVNKVDVEITPEPTEEERRAILEALAEEHPDALALSLWRRAALGPGPHDDADQAVAPPRHRRGATRA
jgi:hypothetical protein